jgi:hypothetical protein
MQKTLAKKTINDSNLAIQKFLVLKFGEHPSRHLLMLVCGPIQRAWRTKIILWGWDHNILANLKQIGIKFN